jgi:hypothetical protein
VLVDVVQARLVGTQAHVQVQCSGRGYTLPAQSLSHSLTGSVPVAAQPPPSRSMYLGRVPFGPRVRVRGLARRAPRGWPHPTNLAGVTTVTSNGAADRIRPRGRPVPVAVDCRHPPMRRSGVSEPTSVPDYQAANYGRIVHSTPPVTAQLMTAVVPSLWIAQGRELTGSWALVPRGPTSPEESWSRSWPSMSLSAWHSPSAERQGISTGSVQIGRSPIRIRLRGPQVDAASG